MLDAGVKSLDARGEVHGPVEGKDGIECGEAAAKVCDGGGGAVAACAVGKYQGWGLIVGSGVGVALDWVFDEVGRYGEGRVGG